MAAKTGNTILALAFESGQLAACLATRKSDRTAITASVRAAMNVDPLADDPELVGREIHNILQGAQIRERRCVVSVPLHWALSASVEIPDGLSDEDRQDYIELALERGFPYSSEDLSLSMPASQNGTRPSRVLMTAIPRAHVESLCRALHAAQLKPQAVTLAIAPLVSMAGAADTEILLRVGERDIDMALRDRRGLINLRCLPDAVSLERNTRHVDIDQLSREIRISIGRLSRDPASAETSVRIFDIPEKTEELCEDLQDDLDALHCRCKHEDVSQLLAIDAEEKLTGPALSASGAAAWWFREKLDTFQFLPPKPTRLQELQQRFSSRSIMWLGIAAVALVGLMILAFLVQDRRLAWLENKWAAIEKPATAISATQDRIRTYRPWFGEEAERLEILKALTTAMPREGIVWTRSIEIKTTGETGNLSSVACTGYARSENAWLTVLENLRNTPQIQELQVQQVRGESPLQFAVKFQWNEKG
ncbi:MAG: pilus assembly protein PilM [bacterium]